MQHSVSSRAGSRSRPALLVSAVLALLVALTTLLAPGLASTASAADVITNRVIPTISGSAGVEDTLTVDKGVWTPSDVTLSVQWLRGATVIENATADTYKLVAADKDQQIAVRVTATKTDSTSVEKTSVLTAKVADCTGLNALVCGLNPASKAKVSPTNSAAPAITGTPQVGTELTAAPGTWSSGACTTTTCQYQWYAGADPIVGANGLKFTPTGDEEGKTLTVKEWATSADGLSGSVSSAATGAVAGDPRADRTSVALPVVSNTAPRVGDTLFVKSQGTWEPQPAFADLSYQWRADGEDIAGATGILLSVTSEMLGKAISLKVLVAGGEQFKPTTAESLRTAPVAAASTPPGTKPNTPGATKVEPAMTVNVKVKKSGKVVVKALLTSAVQAPVTGQATVKVTRGGGKAVTVDLIKGKIKLSWAKLRKGKHKAKVTYLGNDKLTATSTVVVPFKVVR